MTIEEKYLLSVHKEISLISADNSKKIHVVRDETTDNPYIKKTLYDIDNYSFYFRLSELKHRNLSKIYHVIKGDNEVYIIEEYINGQTLNTVLEQKGALPESQVLECIVQLCDVLSYLHNQKPPIIHRDIKPDNIMCTEDSIIKLIDFDIAREVKDSANRDTLIMGTKEYSAPEQYGYQQTDCRADIYSVGVLIHELVTGKLPQNNITYNGAFRKIIDKCLRLDPDKRYQSISDLRKVLEGLKVSKTKKIIPVLFLGLLCLSLAVYCFVFFNNRENNTDDDSVQISEVNNSLISDVDLYEVFTKIDLGDEKPPILLEIEPITNTIKDITGIHYENVVNAMQEYYSSPYFSGYYSPEYDSVVFISYGKDDTGSMKDCLLFQMNREEISIAYNNKDDETNYYFSSGNKGLINENILEWMTISTGIFESPIIFDENPLQKEDVIGVYSYHTKKIEVFEDGADMKFSYIDLNKSADEVPLTANTIYKLDDNHYWIEADSRGDKNRLIFNFSKGYLTLNSAMIYDNGGYPVSIEGIYTKE